MRTKRYGTGIGRAIWTEKAYYAGTASEKRAKIPPRRNIKIAFIAIRRFQLFFTALRKKYAPRADFVKWQLSQPFYLFEYSIYNIKIFSGVFAFPQADILILLCDGFLMLFFFFILRSCYTRKLSGNAFSSCQLFNRFEQLAKLFSLSSKFHNNKQ